MDKNEALKISKGYLQRVRNSDLGFSEAWLFGSYARGNQHDNSDIDIAIVLKDNVNHTFETEVKLMVIRRGDETLIEPHAFTKAEFDDRTPIVNQIIKYGVRIEI
ncbi:MAG: nucleotidyltransferase domain-containing protein [Prolixibacteraceae bacterium]|jgi:predicted nucleotidyltransferase|nr:nucleotidyltransferase domain-containing protein [Prolixibacteraceae bacterium]